MKIGIGSTNPAKISAVEEAVAHAHGVLGITNDIEFVSLEAQSGVAAQPFSDGETRQGALNRARFVLESNKAIDRAFGLEGGVVELDDGLYSTVWIAVVDQEGKRGIASGMRFRLLDAIASGIRGGKEMGVVMDELCQRENVKHNEGMIGVVTGGVVTRAEAYGDLARIAYGLYLSTFSPTS